MSAAMAESTGEDDVAYLTELLAEVKEAVNEFGSDLFLRLL